MASQGFLNEHTENRGGLRLNRASSNKMLGSPWNVSSFKHPSGTDFPSQHLQIDSCLPPPGLWSSCLARQFQVSWQQSPVCSVAACYSAAHWCSQVSLSMRSGSQGSCLNPSGKHIAIIEMQFKSSGRVVCSDNKWLKPLSLRARDQS
ncbi:hypothetical protein KIL84_008069 [Mauremys mutica]|uniref:Uncharacterized protein n=1 Tax=Mauremys mutica TaxID=74926 RepID=A0A9D3X3Z2_9SAUR|nr:hypothetical protein KIL84_008069 [Mauremys mutica]